MCATNSRRTIPDDDDSSPSQAQSLFCLAAKKRSGGGGMAEKRARRQARQQRIVSTDHLPKSNVVKSLVAGNHDDDTASATPSTIPGSVVKTTFDHEKRATLTKAQELLQRQRESVAMLTLVREKVEALPVNEICDALQRDGFYIHDNLLLGHDDSSTDDHPADSDDNRCSSGISSVILENMQQEGVALLYTSFSQADVQYLALGEYTCSLQGGEEQYKTSPRSIEWVVSVTKHLPELLNNKKHSDDDHDYSDDDVIRKFKTNKLDPQKCIALMRTFDRKARIAARKLLVAAVDENESDSDDAEELAPRPFVLAATKGETDLKQLSMRYYLVPSDWDSLRHGGGLAFQKGNRHNVDDDSSSTDHVEAVCDRLVLWNSHETRYQSKPWFGDAQHDAASCIELHLVSKE
jgi:hypothetical protein